MLLFGLLAWFGLRFWLAYPTRSPFAGAVLAVAAILAGSARCVTIASGTLVFLLLGKGEGREKCD